MSPQKITINLTEDAAMAVRELAAARGVSVSEVVRTAIATEKFVAEELASGAQFLLRRDDSTERIRFVR